MKRDYSQAKHKKAVQRLIFKDVRKYGYKQLIGLAGPNISDYLNFVKKNGISDILIYENDFKNLLTQMKNYNHVSNVSVKFQDIINAPIFNDCVYDLDFCCSIQNARKYLKKFKNNSCIITFSLRPIGLRETIAYFAKLMSTKKPIIEYNFKITDEYRLHKIVISETVSYDCYQYSDTVPMLTIKSNF